MKGQCIGSNQEIIKVYKVIQDKIDSFLSYIKAIGLIATVNYIIQRYITRKEMIVLSLPGIREKIHLRRKTKDVNVFHQIFIKRDLVFLTGKDCKICIDAGANIGLSTIFIKNLFPDAHIYSIEPEASNIEMLMLNTKGYKNITVIGKAMSVDSNGLFFVDSGNGSDSFQTVIHPIPKNDLVRINSISVNELILQYELEQLDFVKIDIEGAEDFCINQEAMNWINRSELIAIEIHEHFVPGCTKRIRSLLGDFKFSQNGEYSIFEKLF